MSSTFDAFLKEKEDFLAKKDKSKKGSIDKDILKLVNKINSMNDYYTTSSCSGRILLIERKSKKKNDARWIFTSHDKLSYTEICASLQNQKFQNDVWFKQEPFILHVACRNLYAAKKFLEHARRLFKRAGIIGLSDKKIMIEVIGTEKIETIVANKDFIAGEKYLYMLVRYANYNLVSNKKKIATFYKIVSGTSLP